MAITLFSTAWSGQTCEMPARWLNPAVQTDIHQHPGDDTAHGHTAWHWPIKWRKSQVMRSQDRTERQPTNVIQLAIRISCISAVRLGRALESREEDKGTDKCSELLQEDLAGCFRCVREASRQLLGAPHPACRWLSSHYHLGTGAITDRLHSLRPLVESWGCCCQPQTGPRGQATAKADGTELTPEKITQQRAIGLWFLVVLGSHNFLSFFLRIFHRTWICTWKHGMSRTKM